MASKVVKVFFVVDEDTAEHLDVMSQMTVKERELSRDRFTMVRSGVEVEIHYVQSEVM